MTVEKRILVSSYGISGIEANDIYMAVKVKMLSDRRNLNDMRVTAAFIEKVAADHQQYIGTPLVVDKLRLESGQYNRLTHMQDERTGAFHSQQIGSFVAFEVLKEEDGETVLVGTARVEKRFERACAAIQQLYEMDKLRVSFEIIASVYTQTTDEIIIDADDGNKLIGMCIVSIPAYEDAKALALIASLLTEPNQAEEIAERNELMAEAKKLPSTPVEKPDEKDKEKETTAPTEEKDTDSKKPETKKAEASDPVIEALMEKIEALEQEKAYLSPFKDKWEANEAAARKAEEDKKRATLRQLLVNHGLKAEDYQAAIEQLDYAQIVSAVNEAFVKSQTEVKQAVPMTASANGLVQQGGMQMAGNKSDHPYHKLVKDLTL